MVISPRHRTEPLPLPARAIPPLSLAAGAALSERTATAEAPVPASLPEPQTPPSNPSPSVRERRTYQPQFDGLRAIAIATVVLDHFGSEIPNFPLPDDIHLGPIGVRLFLVLSGYFITTSLRHSRERVEQGQSHLGAALRDFYSRRFLRIGPPYALFVAMGLLLNLGIMRESLGWLLTFTVNFFTVWRNEWPPASAHLWSICVQEQFYLVWPVLIFYLPRRFVLGAIAACATAGVAFRIGCVETGAPLLARWVLTLGSFDSLGAGALLGWAGGRLPGIFLPRRSFGRWLTAGCCLLLLTAAGILRNLDPTRLITVLVEPLEAAALVWLTARTLHGFEGPLGRLLSWSPLRYVGRISYGIYVYHVLVSICLLRWLPEGIRWLVDVQALRLVTLSAATLAVASFSWHFLEQPAFSLASRRKMTSRSQPPVEAKQAQPS